MLRFYTGGQESYEQEGSCVMPEYRRFIAYFYEYIDGKKEKNAGFAKVELRNGMWRILFRLTVGELPQSPVQAYGFVRKQGYLLGLPMGKMQEGREIAEEWAYRADSPIGSGQYRMEELAGIWIQSNDGRHFVTVWDDDPIDTDKFVLELPQETKRIQEERLSEEVVQEEEEQLSEEVVQEEEERLSEESAQEEEKQVSEKAAQEEEAQVSEKAVQEDSESVPENADIQMEISTADSIGIRSMETASGSCPCNSLAEELMEKRQKFQPFPNPYFVSCVKLLPCDIVRMQQENWQVGRSSFLQHGFYQYQHLLLGKTEEGRYVLGIPGLQNRQEQYMAGMLGYDQFRAVRRCGCGHMFGYWCRELTDVVPVR